MQWQTWIISSAQFINVISCFNATVDAVSLGNGSEDDNVIGKEALQFISDGLESKVISVLQDLLSSSHPDQMVRII